MNSADVCTFFWWQEMARAINRRELLRMEYQRFDGVVGHYELESLHLVAYHGNWHLLARNVAASKMETFALSRCRSLVLTGRYFTVPAGFNPRAFFQTGFGITQAEQPWQVRLLFSPVVATYIKERVWHTSQEFKERLDGRLEMRLTTFGRKELVRWLLSWMPDVKVLAPRELRERIQSRLKEGLNRRYSVHCPLSSGQ